MPEPSKVFVSYSHDSADHKGRVLALAERLREAGVDADLDQFEEDPPEGWPRWMMNRVAWADFVLVVVTREYLERFRAVGPRPRGMSVTWEGAILTQELYDEGSLNNRFVPVVLAAEDAAHVPPPLKGATRYDLSNEAGYEALYRRLTGQPLVRKRAVGEVRSMPERRAGARSIEAAAPGTELDRAALLELLECTRVIGAFDTLAEFLDRLLEVATRLIGAAAGSVILHDPGRGDLYFAAASGPKRDEVLKLRVPLDGSKAGDVFKSGRTFVERVVVGHFDGVDQQTSFSTRSMICVPLGHGERRYGVIQMLNKTGGDGAFDARDVELLTRLAVQGSIALQRTTTIEALVGSAGLYAAADVRRDLVPLLVSADAKAVREKLTVLAVDMRGFTLLCEAVGDPAILQDLLREFVSMLADVAVARRGIVNKVVGDGLFALFRWPDGASNALDAARDMLERFDAMRARWKRDHAGVPESCDLGVGIATGEEMILGTVGNERFRDLTVIGPAVNVAALLVDAARDGRRLLCDRATRESLAARAGFRAREPLELPMKGTPGRSVEAFVVETVPARTRP